MGLSDTRIRGVRQVVQFNWPKVAGGLLTSLAGLLLWRRLPGPLKLVAAGAIAWTPLSLVASWWVYDHSELRHWRFFGPLLNGSPKRILLIIAGFDEVSPVLREVYPDAAITVVDVVSDPEPSVRRARAWYPSDAPVVDPTHLDQSGEFDLVLFAQSAHEIRDLDQRNAMFASARAALAPDGCVVVVEHLRDMFNYAAYGPGALHFETRLTWRAAFAAGGLTIRTQVPITLLVRCWVLEAR